MWTCIQCLDNRCGLLYQTSDFVSNTEILHFTWITSRYKKYVVWQTILLVCLQKEPLQFWSNLSMCNLWLSLIKTRAQFWLANASINSKNISTLSTRQLSGPVYACKKAKLTGSDQQLHKQIVPVVTETAPSQADWHQLPEKLSISMDALPPHMTPGTVYTKEFSQVWFLSCYTENNPNKWEVRLWGVHPSVK